MSIPGPPRDIVVRIIDDLINYGYMVRDVDAVSRTMIGMAEYYRAHHSDDIQEQSEDLTLVESAMNGSWDTWPNFDTIHAIGGRLAE